MEMKQNISSCHMTYVSSTFRPPWPCLTSSRCNMHALMSHLTSLQPWELKGFPALFTVGLASAPQKEKCTWSPPCASGTQSDGKKNTAGWVRAGGTEFWEAGDISEEPGFVHLVRSSGHRLLFCSIHTAPTSTKIAPCRALLKYNFTQ